MVCGIHVEPDAGHSYDPYTQAALYPEPCFCTSDIDDDDGNRSINHHPVYPVWYDAGIRRTACELFPLSDSLHPALYAAGNQFEKSVRSSLWRAVVKEDTGYDYDRYLDEVIWSHRIPWIEHGLLGIHDCCCCDCHSYECCFLGHETEK